MHCDRPFDKPYRRLPEMEGRDANKCVLECPYCGLMTVFQEVELERPT
jgi:hypothetical protein